MVKNGAPGQAIGRCATPGFFLAGPPVERKRVFEAGEAEGEQPIWLAVGLAEFGDLRPEQVWLDIAVDGRVYRRLSHLGVPHYHISQPGWARLLP